jgi:acyl-CoA dehydrogenase
MAMDDDSFQQVLDTVSRFARERLIPAETEVEETEEIPESIVQEIRELGLFGLSIPEEYGGLELNVLQESQVVEALTYASMSFRSLVGTNVGIGAQGIVMEGTDAQKQQYLPGLASGELIASFALTEPDNGSDASHIRTSARKDGSDYVINGTKRYITNAVRADVLTLFARTNPDEPGAGGVSAFLVPTNTPGITIAKPDRKMGQRGTKTSDVILEDVRIPEEFIVGGPQNVNRGFRTAMKVLDRGRVHVSSMAVGTAQRMLDEAVNYAITRKQFGVPICDHQLVQGLLADSQAELAAARALVRDAARKYDETGAAVLEASCAKYFCTEVAGRVADRAVQVHGGAGYMSEYPIERLYRDARLLRIYEGTSQIQQIIIARNIIKAARDRM